MKALRFFFLSLLTAFAFAASAQTIEIYKDGRVIDSFTATQVDSVVYKSAAAQPRYYYYAGWTKPESEADLAEFAKTPNGGEITNMSSFYLLLADQFTNGNFADWFIVIPSEIGIYGPDGAHLVEDTFKSPDISTIAGYRIFSKRGYRISGYVLKATSK